MAIGWTSTKFLVVRKTNSLHSGCESSSHVLWCLEMRKLPSLRALYCFEAVSNFDSFTAAANELNLTHGAISHQIRTLEEWFGKKLFIRHSIGVSLTTDGSLLKEACSKGFELIESECDAIQSTPDTKTVSVGCSSSFLAHWLLPKLGGNSIKGGDQEITISFETKANLRSVQRGEVDILIADEWASPVDGVDSTKFREDRFGPVCKPDIAEEMTQVGDLANYALLHAKSRPNAWLDWGKSVELSLDHINGEMFETLSLSIEAARFGRGVAIAPDIVVKKDLNTRDLVAPFGFSTAQMATYLYFKRRKRLPKEIQIVHDWLISQAEPDRDSCVDDR